METNDNGHRSQQPDSKSNAQSTEINIVSLADKPRDNVEDAEEKKEEASFQRRPQFKLSENNRRRFF